MMTNSNEDGVDKVLANRGGYVYIMESVSVDYEVSARLQGEFPFFLEPLKYREKINTVRIFV